MYSPSGEYMYPLFCQKTLFPSILNYFYLFIDNDCHFNTLLSYKGVNYSQKIN